MPRSTTELSGNVASLSWPAADPSVPASSLALTELAAARLALVWCCRASASRPRQAALEVRACQSLLASPSATCAYATGQACAPTWHCLQLRQAHLGDQQGGQARAPLHEPHQLAPCRSPHGLAGPLPQERQQLGAALIHGLYLLIDCDGDNAGSPTGPVNAAQLAQTGPNPVMLSLLRSSRALSCPRLSSPDGAGRVPGLRAAGQAAQGGRRHRGGHRGPSAGRPRAGAGSCSRSGALEASLRMADATNGLQAEAEKADLQRQVRHLDAQLLEMSKQLMVSGRIAGQRAASPHLTPTGRAAAPAPGEWAWAWGGGRLPRCPAKSGVLQSLTDVPTRLCRPRRTLALSGRAATPGCEPLRHRLLAPRPLWKAGRPHSRAVAVQLPKEEMQPREAAAQAVPLSNPFASILSLWRSKTAAEELKAPVSGTAPRGALCGPRQCQG